MLPQKNYSSSNNCETWNVRFRILHLPCFVNKSPWPWPSFVNVREKVCTNICLRLKLIQTSWKNFVYFYASATKYQFAHYKKKTCLDVKKFERTNQVWQLHFSNFIFAWLKVKQFNKQFQWGFYPAHNPNCGKTTHRF